MKRGQIILINFSPTSGHEQKGYRPAVVLSHTLHNQKTNLVIVCPVTSQVKGYPFEVEIDTKKVKGVAIVDQIRTLDLASRKYKLADVVSEKTLSEILRKMKLILE